MNAQIEEAIQAIYLYTFGMDMGQWDIAVSKFAEIIEIDYSAVGMSKGQMSKMELKTFLQQLLGKPGLRVHTAISQVLENPVTPSEFLAYYSVRHYKGQVGQAEKFAVFGWYSYRIQDGKIVALTIHVTATEGNPTVLA